MVRMLLEPKHLAAAGDVNAIMVDGAPLLHIAVDMSLTDVVDVLLESQAAVNALLEIYKGGEHFQTLPGLLLHADADVTDPAGVSVALVAAGCPQTVQPCGAWCSLLRGWCPGS
mmetsp:Transcript_23514/g.53123  ORF Transcript_23514/g.53123 Transcript_23514/m.53123 type:complete len:114 (-) Transcript_23514:1370-1711(-)